ncbi:hypothetical protein GCM10010460_23910 [Microbacterium terrae]|nr:hypothetical protein GCM10017594_09210 [Microbacterium terrae]
MPVATEPRHGARDLVGGADLAESVEEAQAFGGQQGGQFGHLHRPSLRKPARIPRGEGDPTPAIPHSGRASAGASPDAAVPRPVLP